MNYNLITVMYHGIRIVKILLQAVITMEQSSFGIPHLQDQLDVIRFVFRWFIPYFFDIINEY